MTGNLASPLNFARFELPRLLPSLKRLLYLDPDVVVQARLLELRRTLPLTLSGTPNPEIHTPNPDTLTLTLSPRPDQVQADLLELWQTPLGEGDAVGAVPTPNPSPYPNPNSGRGRCGGRSPSQPRPYLVK